MQHVTPSAPSYEEAMKCSTVPLSLPQMYPVQPSHQMNPMMMQTSPGQMQPIIQPILQPMVQPVIQPIIQPMPIVQPQVVQNVQPIVQNFNIGGGGPICRACRRPLRTQTKRKVNIGTHLAFLLCCAIGFIVCAPFVYCSDPCLEPKECCSQCGAEV